jgi:hypothetical protein
MNIAEYYNQGHSIEECARQYGLTKRTTIDKIRELEAEIDMPVTDGLYEIYLRKIAVIRALFGYDINMEELRKTDYNTWFWLSWIKTTGSLTKHIT